LNSVPNNSDRALLKSYRRTGARWKHQRRSPRFECLRASGAAAGRERSADFSPVQRSNGQGFNW
jgi:hypothetical protein